MQPCNPISKRLVTEDIMIWICKMQDRVMFHTITSLENTQCSEDRSIVDKEKANYMVTWLFKLEKKKHII